MKLRTKFLMVLSLSVLFSVFLTAFSLSRRFSADEESYINDIQSSLALSAQRQLETRMELLHSQLQPLIASPKLDFSGLPSRLPGCLSAQLWQGGTRIGAFAVQKDAGAPPHGKSHWSLTASPLTPNPLAVRWIGRYGDKTAVLDFTLDWLGNVLTSSHGVMAQLVDHDGMVLQRAAPGSPMGGVEMFHNPTILEQWAKSDPGIAKTSRYESVDGLAYLGTFLPLATEPPVTIVISTPWSAVLDVISRTYRQAILIASLALILAIGLGVAFSATLTRPLQALVKQTLEVSKGNFTGNVSIGGRRDEVGSLARHFNLMSHELNEMREEVRRAERLAALGRFSASIAHEIKNPLGSMLSNLQLITRKLDSGQSPDLANVRKKLAFIEEEIHRANNTITRLMKFARKDEAPTKVIDLRERLSKSIEIVRSQFDGARVIVEVELETAPVMCVANGDQIHEVFLNLTQNALHAMKDLERKELRISLEVRAQLAQFTIQDNGIGMAPEVMEHVFEPFFTTKRLGEGTGLGLAVCHGVILNHRGKIEVTSEPGRGAKFVVTLPLAVSELSRVGKSAA